jgi:hypothetical protein
VTYTVTYPLLSDGLLAGKINAEITGAINLNVHQYTDGSPNHPPIPGLTVSAETTSFTELGPHVVALLINFVVFPDGAAHPFGQLSTLVFDLDDGSPVTLSRVFTNEQAGLNALAAYIRPLALKGNEADIAPVKDTFLYGTEPTEGNYSSWQPSPQGMVISFQDYQIGPYAMGEPHFTVPWSRLPLSTFGSSILTQ